MKIVFAITRSDSIGGAHVHVRDLAGSLIRDGHEVLVVIGEKGPFSNDLENRGIPFHSVSSLGRTVHVSRDFQAFWSLRRIFARWNPDLVSTHSSKAGWLGRIAARSLGIPVIFTAHGWSFTDGIPTRRALIYRTAERLVGPLAKRIITVSEYDREIALQSKIASPDRIIAIHNGMPDIAEEFHADAGREPVRMVQVARFEEQKDHATLLRALSQLRDLNWALELVGDGPLRSNIESLANDLGLRERVTFHGAIRDVHRVLAKCQLFLLITNWEGFPRSILEAMRAKLPVIASDVGGVREAVVHHQTGILVERGNNEAVTDAIRTLLERSEMRIAMGEAGRRRYEEQFTFAHMKNKTYAVYEEVLRSSR